MLGRGTGYDSARGQLLATLTKFNARSIRVSGTSLFSRPRPVGVPDTRIDRNSFFRYIRLDARLGWHLNENLDVSIGLQNLLDPEHQEFHSSSGVEATEIERSIFGKIVWRH